MNTIDLKGALISIAIGIRFRANFSIEDKLGNIVDEILFSKDAFFNPGYFPMIHSGINEKTLANKDTGNTLTINSSNIVLEVNLESENRDSELSGIQESFKREIVAGIMKKNKITQINRIGYINRYLFSSEKLATNFLDKSIGNTISGINDINLRFSKKLMVEESLVKQDINDYHNAIYNIVKKSDKNELFVSIDFQRYYDPFLGDSSLIEYDNFLQKVEGYNSKDFLEWLNNNYGDKTNEVK